MMEAQELLELIDRAAEEQLTELDLAGMNLTELPAEIGKLTQLEKLILGKWDEKTNKATDNCLTALPPEIGNLTNLTTLVLSGNKITEIPAEIGNLTNLTTLVLSGNKIAEIPAAIGNLTNLTTLVLGGNKIAEIPAAIGNLTNLTTLVLGGNKIAEIPAAIGNLTNLTTLDLTSNQIAEIPAAIGNLINLTTLDLWNNQIKEIPAEIGNLTNLTTLDLWNNQIEEIPTEIGNLTNLTILALGSNQIEEIPTAIGNLANLTTLAIGSNQIEEIPTAIGNLTNLIELYLRENKIAEISTAIGNLTNLTILDLGGNQITEISTEIGNSTNLIELYLGGNQIEEIPIEIGNLTNLTRLALSDNQITEIPDWFQLFKNLQRLDLRGNPIPILPEILRKNAERRDAGDPESRFAWRSRRREDSGEAGDIQAILSFYFQTQDPTATEPLYEAKFIIVGEGEAGKTTLAKKLKDPDYALKPDEESTQGIDVIRWDFIQPNGKPFRVNIWDFGGQDIYHATHQFFLTARSLYALLVDNRRENPNFYYWLNVVRLYSNDSPIFIVKNEKGDRNCELNERQLRSEFLQLKESLPTNLSTNRGLSEIQHFIQTHIANLPHIQIPIPKTWIKIRNVLENYAQHRNYISIEEYHTLGKRNGVKDPQERLRISQYLHDLGICLHFQKDSTLKHRVILKPSWATNAVYKVTDTPIVIQNKGRFTTTDLQTIWGDSKYADMQDELLKLMQNFKICYPLGKDTYIAPILLPSDEPVYTWQQPDNLLLRYEYEFMPKGILTRFIIEMHDKIEDLPAPAPANSQLVWKNGVILTNGSARAELIEDSYNRNIRIRVIGFNRKVFLAVIRHEFQKIHDSYERLEYKSMIPCNCFQCKTVPDPHSYDIKELEKRLEKGKLTIECYLSFADVKIRELIDETIESSPPPEPPTPGLTNLQQTNYNTVKPSPSPDTQTPGSIVQNHITYHINEVKNMTGETNSTFNFKGGISGGANPMGGTNDFSGSEHTSNTQIYNSQDLAEAAEEIQGLLNTLSKTDNTYPADKKKEIDKKAIALLNQDPTKRDRIGGAIRGAVKEGGYAILEEILNQPPISILYAGVEGAIKGYNNPT